MASEWTSINLGEVCTKIGSGATPRGGSDVYLATGPFALIRSQNIYNHGFRHDGLAYIGEKHAAELDGVEVREGDVLLNITGDSVARACQVDPEVLPARVNQHVAIIRPDPSRLDPRFLRYCLVSPEMQGKLLSWAGSGGTRNALTKSMIESFDVPAPDDVQEQRAIAYILGTLDDKIELNRRMSATLEAMARALFKSWFVDFDPVRAKAEGRDTGLPEHLAALFPDRLVESELGEVPAGWGLGHFANFVEHLRGKENPLRSPDKVFRHFSIPAYDEGEWPTEERGESIKSQKSSVPSGVVLLSKLNPDVERVWLVDVQPDDRAVCSTEFLVLRPRPPFGRAYLYCLSRSADFRQQLQSLVTGTSKSHQRAPVDAVFALRSVCPPAKLAIAFEERAESLLRRRLECRRESCILASLRETLLRKLISGGLRIPEATTLLAAVDG